MRRALDWLQRDPGAFFLPLALLAAVAFIISCPRIHAQDEYNQSFGPPTTSGATLIESDGFEVTSEDPNCANSTLIDFKLNTPSCDYTTQHFVGSEACQLNQAGTGDQIDYRITPITDGTVELRGYVFLDDGGAAGTSLAMAIALYNDPGAVLVAHIDSQDDGSTKSQVRCVTTDTTGSTTTGITGDTWYKFCLRYDLDNDDAECYLDPSGGTFCAGATWTSTADDTVTHPSDIDGFKFKASTNTSQDLVIDGMEFYDNG